MTAQEIDSLIQEKLGSQPGFDAAASQQFAGHVADAIAVSGVKALGGKADCYKKCQDTRDAATLACAAIGWPAGMLCVGQAVLAFNACRHQCDQR